MPDAFEVVVIGGGLAGTAVARELAVGGVRTALFDRRDPGRATDAGAGILSPETTRNEGDAWFELATASGAHYRRLTQTLVAEGLDPGYSPSTSLVLAVADWDLDAYREAAALVLGRQAARRADEPGTDELREITPHEARDMFPPLGEVTGALLNPGAARVDGRRMEAALRASAVTSGLQLVHAGVDRLVVHGGRVEGVESDAGELTCGAVVIAGGAWSPALAGQLGVPLGVFPARGQILHLEVDDDVAAWPILQPVLGYYLVPFPGGRIVVGASVEPEAGFVATATAGGLRGLASEALRIAPGLVDARFVEVRVGLRPMSEDGLPLLGPLDGHDNVHVATGYGVDGLLLSPFAGHLVATAALGHQPATELSPFSPNRFSR